MPDKGDFEVKPLVYILILNWNGWRDTIECLESVFRNDYPSYRVIVCDNNSSDGSLDYIKKWADGLVKVELAKDNPLRDLSSPPIPKPVRYVEYDRTAAEAGGDRRDDEARLILIQTGANLGFAGGNNVGLRYVMARDDFDYVWLLNNDTVVGYDALSNLIKVAESNRLIGIVGSKLFHYYLPQIIQTMGGTDQITWKTTGDYIHSFEPDNPEFNNDFEVKGYICGASLLIKKSVLESIGLLDENYFMWAEEVDWCFSAVQKGWKLYYCGTSHVWHKEGGSCGRFVIKNFCGKKSKRETLRRFVICGYYDIRNHIYFIKKYFKRYLCRFILHLIPLIIKRYIGIIVFDDNKLLRMMLLTRGLFDGIIGKTGKTIDPTNVTKVT